MSFWDFRIFNDFLVNDSRNGAVRCTGDLKGMSDGNMGIVLDVTEGLFMRYEFGEGLALTDVTE
jgi:hypothetical protein